MWYGRVDIDIHFSDFSFFGIGMCLDLMSWVQQVHNAAIVARSLGCQCDSDTEMPTGRTLPVPPPPPVAEVCGPKLEVIRKLENYPTLGRDVGWALGPV